MDETSTTSTTDNAADATGTTTAPNTETDNTQTGNDANNLESSQSTAAKTGDSDSTKTETSNTETPPAKFDDDIDDWITKRKLPKPATDDDKQAYQDLRNSQREFTREQQAKKDAEALKSATDAHKPTEKDDDENEDPLEKKVRLLEQDRNEERDMRLKSEFYIANKVTTEQHNAILDIFKEKMEAVAKADTKTQQKVLDTWSTPEALRDLLDLAKARVQNASTATNSEVAEKAAQAEREKIARESQAKSATPSARNFNPTDTSLGDERTKALVERYSTKK